MTTSKECRKQQQHQQQRTDLEIRRQRGETFTGVRLLFVVIEGGREEGREKISPPNP